MNIDGWIDDKDAVDEVVSTLEFADVSLTPIGSVPVGALPENVYLWDIARKVTGSLLPPKNQGKVGSCVSFATARAITYTMLAEIASGEKESYVDICEEVIYGGSRVEIGGGMLRGDGSVGAWAAKWVSCYGLVVRGSYGDIDLSSYSETRCREYGAKGVPTELELEAKLHPVSSATRVRNWDDAKRALANGYGISLCSNQGFTMARDKDGVATKSGSWAHAMCLCGYAKIGSYEYGRIDNSWGSSAHTGPVGPGNPGPEGFYARADIIHNMLNSGDCWIYADVTGFKKRELNWLI